MGLGAGGSLRLVQPTSTSPKLVNPMRYDRFMPNRSSKRKDLNELAHSIVQQAIGAERKREPKPKRKPPSVEGKDPAAVELGRRGGLKGGPARAAKLSAKKRSQIAKKAAVARWGQK